MKRKIRPEPPMLVAPAREWRALKEFPDYEISNDGRLRRLTAGSNTKAKAPIRATLTSNGYPKYGLSYPGGLRVYRNAHRLVAAEFLGPAPFPGALVLHDDDNRLNCIATNLKWGAVLDNISDAKRNGRLETGKKHSSARRPWDRPRGEKHTSAKLNEAQVLAIMADDRGPYIIARDYGVHGSLIQRIKDGLVWRHITNPTYGRMLEEGRSRNA